MTLLDLLLHQIQEKSQHQVGQEAAPLCILWPDKTREWEVFLPLLKGQGLSVLTFGAFEPGLSTGPAPYLLWSLYHGKHSFVPVVYLPGVGVDELKASDSCPAEWQPIAALRYQSTLFTHPNGKDWTLAGWFGSNQGAGLSLQDSDQTRNMLRSSFKELLLRPLADLKDILWTPENLTGAVVSDPVLSALQWLGGGKSAVPADHWSAFLEKASRDFGFKPDKQTPLEVAGKILQGTDKKLDQLWNRFTENPKRYPQVITQFETIPLPKDSGDQLFPLDMSRYPQWFKSRHDALSVELRALGSQTDQHQLISKIEKLWGDYQELESNLWAKQTSAFLIPLLKDLKALSKAVQARPTSHDWPSLVAWYSSSGMEADRLVLSLSGWKLDLSLRASLQSILQNLYLPWLQNLAQVVQQAYQAEPGYCTNQPLGSALPYITHEAVLFVDALRIDLGAALGQRLSEAGLTVEQKAGVTVLPTVTSTAKAAVSPLAPHLKGGFLASDDAYPLLDGKPCNADVLRKGLSDRGWVILKPDQLHLGPYGWMENSDLDSRGHDGTLADQWSSVLDSLVFTIQELFSKGWKRVRVVTDHGFLLTPQDLPKTSLAPVLVESKGGRAAIMKPNSQFPNLPVPWYWDPVQNYNLAPGISTFYQSKFAHGGLSLQELVVPTLLVTSPQPGGLNAAGPVDATLIWKGLRLRIGMDEHPENWTMDLRTDAGDPSSSLLGRQVPLAASVPVDDDHYGKRAQFLIMNETGTLIFQKETVIGE